MTLGACDIFDLRFLRDASLSPDGQCVAYALSWAQGEVERYSVGLVSVNATNLRDLPFAGDAASPRWSPDGKWLAFIGNGRLYVADVVNLCVGPALTPEGAVVVDPPSWCPDSDRLVVSLRQHQRLQGPRRLTVKHYRAEGIGFVDALAQTLFIASRSSSIGRPLTSQNHGFCSQPQWSPCGRKILFRSTFEVVPFASYSPNVSIINLDTSEVSVVLTEPWYILAARWMPGGRIVFAGAYDSKLAIPNPTLWVLEQGSEPECCGEGLPGKLGGLLHHDMPCWDLTSNILVVIDDSRILVTTLSRGSFEVWQVALNGARQAKAVLAGERSCIALSCDPSGQRFVYAQTTLRTPPELFACSLDGAGAIALTDLNAEVLAHWPNFDVRHLTFKSHDGLEIEGWFLSDCGSAGPLPTVMFIHGGPYASTGHAFRYDLMMLAAQGYGVLFVNFRGSAGYGDEFTRLITGDQGGNGFPDHMGAIDRAIELGFSNPERLGVWGPSHGGFATYWIVGHTDRFKAAVAEAANCNLVTAYYLSDAPETRAREMGGKPHEIPELYRLRSPITYAHRCTTPTMMVHGEEDLRCVISEAEQFYRALHDAGCPTELVRIPNCNHLGDSCGPIFARRAQNEALLRWFRTHL